MSGSNIDDLDILRWEEMTDTVRKFPSTGPKLFTDMYRKKDLRGTDVAVWDELSKTRRRAPIQVRGAPAQRVDLLSRTQRSAAVADIFISKSLKAADIEYLRRPGSASDAGAQAMINDELEDMNEIIDNTVEHACMSVARGSWSVNQSTSTTAVKSRGVNFTLTFAVTALDSGAANSGPGSWATASNKIYTTGLTAVMDKMENVAGMTPTRAIHNRATEDLLLQNDEVKAFLGEQYKTQLLRSGHISNIRGIEFNPYNSGDDDGGSFAKYWSNNHVLFLPESTRHLELLEAGALVPAGPGSDQLVMASPGKYSYARVTHNPVGIELFVGYRFIPINKYPEQFIYYAHNVA